MLWQKIIGFHWIFIKSFLSELVMFEMAMGTLGCRKHFKDFVMVAWQSINLTAIFKFIVAEQLSCFDCYWVVWKKTGCVMYTVHVLYRKITTCISNLHVTSFKWDQFHINFNLRLFSFRITVLGQGLFWYRHFCLEDLSYYKHFCSFIALKKTFNQGIEITHTRAGHKLTKMVNH